MGPQTAPSGKRWLHSLSKARTAAPTTLPMASQWDHWKHVSNLLNCNATDQQTLQKETVFRFTAAMTMQDAWPASVFRKMSSTFCGAPTYTLLRREVVFMANPVMANPEEITLYTGNASSPAISGSSSEWEVSDANLNRWLMVRSRSITARYPDSGMTTNARRPRESHPPGSVFTLPGSKTQLTWTRSSREEGPSVHEQVRGRKCVDDNGNTYAMLACLRNFRTHEQRLKMRIVPRNLCRDDIEMVLLDVVAYWAKKMLRTRAHSGWTGITATGPVLSHLGRRLGETEYYM